MARRQRKPTTKEIATVAIVKAIAAERAANRALRKLKQLEQQEASENVIGFRVEQEDDDPPEAD